MAGRGATAALGYVRRAWLLVDPRLHWTYLCSDGDRRVWSVKQPIQIGQVCSSTSSHSARITISDNEIAAVEGESVGLGEREPEAEGTAFGVAVGGGDDDGGNGNDGDTGNAAGAKDADTGRQTSDWFGYWDGEGGGLRIGPPTGFRGYGIDKGGKYGKCTYGKGGGSGGGIGPSLTAKAGFPVPGTA